ncbi:ABC transporter permease [Pinibacter soli]|uniref:ABC transporter permease n=1 Tax=Pinibacter soli TaxID=3044211 RepID=A0ABT6RGL8_9BACT|nr:ABC transporter permease [Pinibacter soli]MDI3321708.1 ABC transporter permease [Pinibacter soli]
MLKNYFKIAWRNLTRNRAFTIINVLGLTLGVACCILIYTLIMHHLSFDNFHNNKDRIYRVVSEYHDGDESGYNQGLTSPVGKAIRNTTTFAEQVARVISFDNELISLPKEKEVKKFQEPRGIAFAEPSFFSILNYPLVMGNQNTILSSPNAAVITQKLAKKYFGSEEAAMNKTIRIENKTDFIITGILKDLPNNTDRHQEIYVSYANLKDYSEWMADDANSWQGTYSECHCFVLLKKGITPAVANAALAGIVANHYNGREAKARKFTVQPLADIHFDTKYDANTDKKYLWALALIAVFLITTACVNFINLATAQALNRAKEIGIRKVLGSMRSQLFWQFIVETLIITLFAFCLAYWIAKTTVPYLNNLLHVEMELTFFNNYKLLLFLPLLLLIVVFLSGSYPGLVLARFQPALALKSKLSQKHIGGFSLRRILVITQFAISQMLIIGAIVIASQMHYSQNADMGFTKDAIVVVPVPDTTKIKMSNMRDRLSSLAGVEKISYCFQPPAADRNNSSAAFFNNNPEPEHWSANQKNADENYLSTFGLKLIAGRNFMPSDTTREYVVNETFVKNLGLQPKDIIGKNISVNGPNHKFPVVGVVKDFYNHSFHNKIEPLVIYPDYGRYIASAIKINMNNIKTILPAIEKIWNEEYPDYVYSHEFVDDKVNSFYETDVMMLRLIQIFTGIAVFIGCLGLYGLVSFMAVRKTKEIGVRKVLGASVPNILWIFGKEFSKLLLIAFVIAAPIGWWAMHKYLDDFVYRINIGAGIFILSILATLIIAAITVGYRSARAALANPATSLRTE